MEQGEVEQRGVEDVLLELLAQGQCTTADELRARLVVAGEDLPIDSVLAAEIVAAVQTRFGIRLPAKGAEEYLSSVRAFAAQICAEVDRVNADSGVGGREAQGA